MKSINSFVTADSFIQQRQEIMPGLSESDSGFFEIAKYEWLRSAIVNEDEKCLLIETIATTVTSCFLIWQLL